MYVSNQKRQAWNVVADLMKLRGEKPEGVDWPTYIVNRLDERFFPVEKKEL